MKIRNCSYILLLILLILVVPINANAAEVLQVRSSNLLQIGDRNRSYKVKLACLEVDPTNEEAAINFLKSQFKKNRRINFRPQGSYDGVLIAKVFSIKSEKDFSHALAETGLASLTC